MTNVIKYNTRELESELLDGSEIVVISFDVCDDSAVHWVEGNFWYSFCRELGVVKRKIESISDVSKALKSLQDEGYWLFCRGYR